MPVTGFTTIVRGAVPVVTVVVAFVDPSITVTVLSP